MPTSTIIPQGTYPVGTRSFGPANVPSGLTTGVIAFDRTAWSDPAVTLDLFLEFSIDNGATWAFPAGMGAEGGVARDKNGVVQTVSTLGFVFPDGPTRKVQGTITIAGGPLTTNATLTLT